jgi:hypothetical protein
LLLPILSLFGYSDPVRLPEKPLAPRPAFERRLPAWNVREIAAASSSA